MEAKNMEITPVQTEKTIEIKAPKGNRKRKIKPTKLDAVKQRISFGGKWKAASFLFNNNTYNNNLKFILSKRLTGFLRTRK